MHDFIPWVWHRDSKIIISQTSRGKQAVHASYLVILERLHASYSGQTVSTCHYALLGCLPPQLRNQKSMMSMYYRNQIAWSISAILEISSWVISLIISCFRALCQTLASFLVLQAWPTSAKEGEGLVNCKPCPSRIQLAAKFQYALLNYLPQSNHAPQEV